MKKAKSASSRKALTEEEKEERANRKRANSNERQKRLINALKAKAQTADELAETNKELFAALQAVNVELTDERQFRKNSEEIIVDLQAAHTDLQTKFDGLSETLGELLTTLIDLQAKVDGLSDTSGNRHRRATDSGPNPQEADVGMQLDGTSGGGAKDGCAVIAESDGSARSDVPTDACSELTAQELAARESSSKVHRFLLKTLFGKSEER